MRIIYISVFSFDRTSNKSFHIEDLEIETESYKPLNSNRAARIPAQQLPGFKRLKGRNAIFAGVEILAVMEKLDFGWKAWRLDSNKDKNTAYQPPLSGRVGKANQMNNPYCDRTKGKW